MSTIRKKKLSVLGYQFVSEAFLPAEKDEYFIRYKQSSLRKVFRSLKEEEINVLLENGNFSPNWQDIHVTDLFIPEQIKNCRFYGLVRIGDMKDVLLSYRDLELASGLYNSQIVSCDIGDYVAIHHVRYLAHFIIGNEVMLSSVNEMETSSNAKFGNGILKDGDVEGRRIRLEICNENGGRSVLPFDGMQAGDAYLWTRYRDDAELQSRFEELTESMFSKQRGYYSVIGDKCVIKNSHMIKDVQIGSNAYIKGVNKLKNITVNSSAEAYTQIGEGCELVNGIIGYGCRVFYGVKAVRFVLSSFSQLKYGARLINSFLGDNSTISCCEVLNSLLFPAHEQHHNNSFLCAALVKGQSNMAAGATVGSNHNSRAADGELVAGRGFWPGLCVSLKHNSRFASYTLIVKGDFVHELDIRLPFSLISLDLAKDELNVIPGYWFLYNMYALWRNEYKFLTRDKRKLKNQYFEYDILAPDTINEIMDAMEEIEKAVAKSQGFSGDFLDVRQQVKSILCEESTALNQDVFLENVENSKRNVRLAKTKEGYAIYTRMIKYYIGCQIVEYLKTRTYDELMESIERQREGTRSYFENVGGQLIQANDLDALIRDVKQYKLESWSSIHERYRVLSKEYPHMKFLHALSCLIEMYDGKGITIDRSFFIEMIKEYGKTKQWILDKIIASRQKDYRNKFKKMTYASEEEMAFVLGSLDDNRFIAEQKELMKTFDVETQFVVDRLTKQS